MEIRRRRRRFFFKVLNTFSSIQLNVRRSIVGWPPIFRAIQVFSYVRPYTNVLNHKNASKLSKNRNLNHWCG